MIHSWFDATDAVLFAQTLARDIDKLFPPTARKRKAGGYKKDRKRLDGLLVRTRRFTLEHKLNIYTKAKLLNTVKWELREGGHDATLIDEIVQLLAPLLR